MEGRKGPVAANGRASVRRRTEDLYANIAKQDPGRARATARINVTQPRADFGKLVRFGAFSHVCMQIESEFRSRQSHLRRSRQKAIRDHPQMTSYDFFEL